ncbi:MAG: hypothetical protein Q8K86_11100, partial [Candidatus Nanopelagicaceae bacterium]|nr:hypothetical protein [Candidatus Nanopelagicaceae bacterium]
SYTTKSTITVSGTSGTLTASGASSNVVVDPAAASYLKITGTATMNAGGTNAVTITAYDTYKNTVTTGANNYTTDKTITFSGANLSPNPATSPTASNKLSADVNFGTGTVITFTNGVGTSTLKLYKAEAAEVDITDSTINSTGAADRDLNITVSATTKNKLLWSTQPATPVIAGAVWTSFTIEVTDTYGNRTADIDSVTIAPSAGSFSAGTLTKAAVSGLATFNDMSYTTKSTITVSGTSGTLTASGASSNVVVDPAAASYLKITGTATMNAGGTNAVTITAYDTYNNTVTTGANNYTADKTITFSGANLSPNPGTSPTATNKLSADVNFGTGTVITFTNGVGTSTLKLYKAEAAEVDITDSTINSTGAADRDLNITVSATTKNKLLWSTQPATPVIAGAVWTSFTIEVTDTYG